LFTHILVPLSPSTHSTRWYWLNGGDSLWLGTGEITVGMAKSCGSWNYTLSQKTRHPIM